jgi:biotin operon repressor
MRIVGDVTGRQFTSVCAPEETRRAREVFASKIAGTAEVTDAEVVLVQEDGERIGVEVSSVPLYSGDRIIGVFGQLVNVDEEPDRPLHPHLTPRQAEVLRLLERGQSTQQIARELHLSLETVRNHIRHLLRALGVHFLPRGGRARPARRRRGQLRLSRSAGTSAASRAGDRRRRSAHDPGGRVGAAPAGPCDT